MEDSVIGEKERRTPARVVEKDAKPIIVKHGGTYEGSNKGSHYTRLI